MDMAINADMDLGHSVHLRTVVADPRRQDAQTCEIERQTRDLVKSKKCANKNALL